MILVQPVGHTEHGKCNIVNPADYPTHLIQPAFEIMRRHKNFRAAWVLSRITTEPGTAQATMAFSSATQLTLTRNDTNGNANIGWFVIEFTNNAFNQHLITHRAEQ